MAGRRVWIVAGCLSMTLLVALVVAYSWRQMTQRRAASPTHVAVSATVVSGPATPNWAPVQVKPAPGGQRIIPLSLDAEQSEQRCGVWDKEAQRRLPSWQEQAICVAMLAAGVDGPVGGSLAVTRSRWGEAADALSVPRIPGPSPEQWVVVVRIGRADGEVFAVILDDATGAPYMLIRLE
jgi:hypothetical protein